MAEKVLISFEVDSRGAISNIQRVKREIGDEVPKATQKAEGGFSRLTRTLAAVGTAFAAIGAAKLVRSLVDVGGQVIRTGAQFETMAIQMRAVTGSTQSAAEAMDWITEFTANTPYQLEQVTDAFVRMRAMGLDPMDGTMQAVADMTSYLGGSMETMNSIVLALGKSFTVGKMSMEELRMLAERGVPVFDILSDKLGVTNQRIVEMSAKGQLGRDAIQLLIEGMGELAGGASQNLMESFTGLWSNLQDQITLAMKELAEGGVLDAVKDALRGLLDQVTEFRESGRLAEWGRDVGEALAGLIEKLPDVIAFVRDLAKNLAEIIPLAIELGKIWAGLWIATKVQAFHAALIALPGAFRAAAAGARSFQAALGPVGVLMVAAGITGEALATMFDRMNRSLDMAQDYEQQMRSLAEAINMTYGSVAKFSQATDMSLEQAYEYIETLKEEGKLKGKWAEIETLRQALLKSTTANVESNTVAVEDNTKAVGDFTEEVKESTEGITLWDRQYIRAGQNFYSLTQTYITQGRNFGNILKDDIGAGFEAAGDAASDATTFITETFGDMLARGFTGEFESFSEVWDESWAGLARSATKLLGDVFGDSFGAGGSIFKQIGSFFTNLKNEVAEDPLGTGFQGAGMMYGGYQQGGAGGAIQGAMGGLMLGLNPALLSATGGLSAIIGPILGGALSLFGGEDATRYRVSVGPDSSYQTRLSGPGASSEARHAQTLEMVSQYRASIMAMNSVLRLFEEGDLFDFIRDAPEFNFEGEAKFDEIVQVFREQWLPTAMRQMFRRAINRGLRQFGVDETTRRQLWSEIQALTGADQIQGLETYISALVNTSHLLDDMDWNVITDETRMSSMERFFANMGDTVEAIQNQMLGLDSMTLLERAGQAETINNLILNARQAEIQMLQQIDQIQRGINDSIDRQIEGIRTGGMSETELQQYYVSQIQDIMTQLREGVSSPEAIQQLMGDLQRYTGAYQSIVGDQLYAGESFGYSTADWLVGILEEARGLSNDAFEEMRDSIRETNEALIEELQRLIEALTTYGDSVATADQTTNVPNFDVDIGVNVNVNPSPYFDAYVDAKVSRAVWAATTGANNGPLN